jgi:PPOX class probable F420-dependent enzyme
VGYDREPFDGHARAMNSWERARLEAARVGRLATVRPAGTPHVVVVTFASAGDQLVTAVDQKPKRTSALQRLRNVEARPAVSLLVDHYEEDWAQLWWVRVDGVAAVVTDEPRRSELLAPLVEKYRAYREDPPAGPVLVIDVRRTTSWQARG